MTSREQAESRVPWSETSSRSKPEGTTETHYHIITNTVTVILIIMTDSVSHYMIQLSYSYRQTVHLVILSDILNHDIQCIYHCMIRQC